MRVYDVEVMSRHYSQEDLMTLARTAVAVSKAIDTCVKNLDRTEGTIAEYLVGVWHDINGLGMASLDAVALQWKGGAHE